MKPQQRKEAVHSSQSSSLAISKKTHGVYPRWAEVDPATRSSLTLTSFAWFGRRKISIALVVPWKWNRMSRKPLRLLLLKRYMILSEKSCPPRRTSRIRRRHPLHSENFSVMLVAMTSTLYVQRGEHSKNTRIGTEQGAYAIPAN